MVWRNNPVPQAKRVAALADRLRAKADEDEVFRLKAFNYFLSNSNYIAEKVWEEFEYALENADSMQELRNLEKNIRKWKDC